SSRRQMVTGHLRHGSGQTGHLGLCTDLYELRMVESYLKQGMTARATFSLFVRPNSTRPWFVALGVERVLELLSSFDFGPEELDELERLGVDAGVRDELAEFTIDQGEVWAVPEGTVLLAQEPVLEVTAPLPVAQLLETAVMNLVQYPMLVATKAARCSLVAAGGLLADFGFRRAHGIETGIEAALAAYIGGGFATSNVEAGRRYDVPTTGTMAHSYVQAFTDERDAFRRFASDHPEHSVLLVDTYDTVEGVRRAIEVCHELDIQPRGVRLDSGDLGELAVEARRLLDDAGFEESRVIVSGGLDEYAIHELVQSGAPVDGFGVGTALTVSQDHPGLDIVYKLVDYDGRSVAKFSGVKSTFPGPKQVFRSDGDVTRDVLSVRDAQESGEPLLRPVWRDGQRLDDPFDLEVIRARVTAGLDRLPDSWRTPPYLDEAPLPTIGSDLEALTEQVRRTAFGEDA
ncbi:MAG: nicotinate phosphoribosyltransferase, partial [Nitriliruptoraceae bacterium]